MTDNNLNPLTNLPEKSKPTTEANLEPVNLLKVLPSDPSAVKAPINTFNPYEFSQYDFNQRSDRNLISGMNQESNRAANQSIAAQAGNAVFGGLLGAVGVAIEDLGYMLDVENNAKLLAGIDQAESNWMANIGKSIKDYSHESMPIYRKDPNAIFNPADWGSYFSALGTIIENAVGFAVPGAAALKGVAYAQKLAAYNRLLRVSKATAGIARTGAAGYISNVGESKMMALETFEETKRDLMENYGMSEEVATRKAGDAARDMYLWNKTLLATNMFELHGLSRIKASRSLIKSDELKSLGKRYKEGLTKFSSDNLLLQGLSEYAEETGQGILANESQYKQTEGLQRRALRWDEDPFQEQNSNLFVRAIDQFMQPETQYEGVIGFFAGAGQRVVTDRLGGDRRLKYLQEEYDNQQKVIADTQDFLANKVNDHKELEKLVANASLNSDDNMVELIRRANLVKIANRNFRNGTAEGLENLLQDRVEQGIDGADADLQFVKSLEKQWNNALRFKDADITEKVFHAKQSINLAQDRITYLQEQAKEVEEEIEKTPNDQILKIQKSQLDNEIKEMGLVVKGLEKALKTVSSKKYEDTLKEAKTKIIQEKLQQQQQALANQKKKKENKNLFSTVAKTLKERVSSMFKKDEVTPATPAAPEAAVPTPPTTEAGREQVIGPDYEMETVPDPPKAKRTRKKKTVEEELSAEPKPKRTARKAKTVVQESVAEEQTAPDRGSKFTYVNPDGSLEMQDAIPGNELPYIAEVQGDVLELTPATNALEGHSLNKEFETLNQAFESETPLKPGDKFLATSPAIYQKNEAGQWELVKKGTVEKFVSSTDTALDTKQQSMRELALKINGIVGATVETADDMVAQLTAAQKLELMNASTQLFSAAAERLLEENPDMSFDSIESFYRVMKEISHTISRDVMKNIFPFIKGFYSPTFQVSPEVNMQVNAVEFDTIFLNDTELEQLIEAANNVFNASLPEEMLTEEKVFGAQQDTDFRLSEPEGEAQYTRRPDPANQLAFLHRVYEQEEDGGVVWRMDTEQFIDDYSSLLDPEVVYPGAEFDVRVVDDNSIPMYLPGASENEMTTWGEIKQNKEHYMKVYGVKSEKALRELLLPIAVYNGDKIIAYIHNAEFINPLRVQGDEAMLKAEAKKLLVIRKAIINGKANKITIENNRPGRMWFTEEAQALSEVFPEGSESTLIIGVKKEGKFVGHNTQEVKHIINDDAIFPGFPYILVPMGDKGHMAIAATPEFISEEVIDSLVNVIHIAMHDGPLSDGLQKIVDNIVETMEIDIRGEKGLQEYVSTFLYNFVPPKEFDSFKESGHRSALDAFIQTRMGQISSDNHFINFTGNSVDFGIGNSAKTFSLSKQTPAADKQIILDLLRDHLANMRFNVSLSKLQENKSTPVVLISRDGMKVINEGGSYMSLVMDGLTTKLRPIDLENGKFSLTYQPAIYFNLKETAQEDTVDEVSAEPDSRPTEPVTTTETVIETDLTETETGPGVLVEQVIEDVAETSSSQLAQELGIEGPKRKARRGKIVSDDMIPMKKEEVSNKTKCKT